jgi:succinate dehydrogenase / fumarate reductase cytochrome b subunit
MNERPLSPHLQVYRLPLTALLSFTHRATGVFLSLGMILLVVFLLAVAQGQESFACVHSFLQSVVGRLFLWAWIYSLLFHLCHGFRHLIWDTGHGFERDKLNRLAAYEIVASLLLIIMVFFLVPFKSWM